LLAHEQCPIDRRHGGVPIQTSTLLDALHQGPMTLLHHRLEGLEHLLRRLGSGDRLGRPLEGADVDEIGLDPEPVEQSLDVHGRGRRTRDRDFTEGREPDAVARREHVIRSVGRTFGMAEDLPSPVGLERDERVTQLLRLGHVDGQAGGAQQETADLVLVGRLAQALGDLAQRAHLAHSQHREALELSERALELDHHEVWLARAPIRGLLGLLERPRLLEASGQELRERRHAEPRRAAIGIACSPILVTVAGGTLLLRRPPIVARQQRLWLASEAPGDQPEQGTHPELLR
jgi:hypothetical protein